MSGADSTTVERMSTYRFVLGLIALLGILGVFLDGLVSGWWVGLLIWLIAFGLVAGFWWLSGRLLEDPSDVLLNALKPSFYSYIFCWVLAFATTYIVIGEIYMIAAMGLLLQLVATYLMREFMVAGLNLLKARRIREGASSDETDATV